MINFGNLEFVIGMPVFPSNSIVEIQFVVNVIADKKGSKQELVDRLSDFLIGKKAKNPTEIEYGLVEKNKSSFDDFILKKCVVAEKELDLYTNILETTVDAEITYCNISVFKKEIKNIKKMKINSLLGSCVIV